MTAPRRHQCAKVGYHEQDDDKFSPEVRERAVRLVFDNEGQHGSRWQAIVSIVAKIGCSAHALNEWVKKAEVDSGTLSGLPTEMAEKMQAPHMEVEMRKNPVTTKGLPSRW